MAVSPGHLTFHTGGGNWSELPFFHTWVGLQRQPKVVDVVWSPEVTPEIHAPSSECLYLIDKTPKSPISGLFKVFPLIKTVSNSIAVKADTWNPSCHVKIWPWATEVDKTSFHQPLFPMIIPRSSSHQEFPRSQCLEHTVCGSVPCITHGRPWCWGDSGRLWELGVIIWNEFFFLIQYTFWSGEPLGAGTTWRKQKHRSQEQDKNDGKTARAFILQWPSRGSAILSKRRTM